MKKTGTTILSFALALIMVSSLGYGVIDAHGKKKYRKVTVRDVVLLHCAPDDLMPLSWPLIVSFIQNGSGDLPAELVVGMECAQGVEIMLNNKWKMQAGSASFHPGFGLQGSGYTFVKTTKKRVLIVNN